MLELKGITKKYEIGTFKQTALDHVDVSFRDNEFVAVLGPSGSGKTTLLNMIGGLDRYDSGDILIDGKSTQHFTDHQWDAYRNHAIGFVFQNYNLITHTSVLSNVEVGMTLSGIGTVERRKRALEVLEKVGLKDHVYKKPNQLSGGQMQRVAIARALANDPEIILADEPTGAIDSETSAQIMTLIKEIAKDKLVIMVTHDQSIAKQYSNRIIDLKDGQIIHDTNPFTIASNNITRLSFKRTSMAFKQALSLSFNNLKTKKFRTLITAFAGSIGIIGVALVLSLANGTNQEIDRLERTTLAEFPIQIDPIPFDLEAAREGPLAGIVEGDEWEKFPENNIVFPFERTLPETQHFNIITAEYLDHLDALDETLYNQLTISRRVNMNLLKRQSDGEIINVNTSRINFNETLSKDDFFEENYDLLIGERPTTINEVMVVVDEYNRLNINILSALGLSSNQTYTFEDFLTMQLKIATPDDYYTYNEATERYQTIDDFDTFFDSDDGISINVVGIARVKAESLSSFLSPGIKYHPDLTTYYLDAAKNSDIGQDQVASDTSVITGLPLSSQAKQEFLRVLGVDDTPSRIRIYPVSYDDKNAIIDHLDAYNEGRDEADEIRYTDIASLIIELTGNVVDAISYVLVAFSAISLLVSSIMIGIITYVSVLERTKEIGILRSLGARKRDISRVFNAETTIIGFVAGSFGIIIAFILTFPINFIIRRLIDDVGNLAVLPLYVIILLIFISITLTFIAGLIPAKIAANKDPVEALRVD